MRCILNRALLSIFQHSIFFSSILYIFSQHSIFCRALYPLYLEYFLFFLALYLMHPILYLQHSMLLCRIFERKVQHYTLICQKPSLWQVFKNIYCCLKNKIECQNKKLSGKKKHRMLHKIYRVPWKNKEARQNRQSAQKRIRFYIKKMCATKKDRGIYCNQVQFVNHTFFTTMIGTIESLETF